MDKQNEIVLYQPNEQTKLEVLLEEETVWLSQQQMAQLFGKDQSVVARHISNVFREGEVQMNSNMHILHNTLSKYKESNKMKNILVIGIILSVMCSCDSIEGGGGSSSSSKIVAYVRQGMSDYGTVEYTYDGHYIRQGMGAFGTVIWTYDGHYIREGMNDYGKVIWTYDGHYIRQGMGDYGKVVYTFDGHYIRSGMGDYGAVVYTIDYK